MSRRYRYYGDGSRELRPAWIILSPKELSARHKAATRAARVRAAKRRSRK